MEEYLSSKWKAKEKEAEVAILVSDKRLKTNKDQKRQRAISIKGSIHATRRVNYLKYMHPIQEPPDS